MGTREIPIAGGRGKTREGRALTMPLWLGTGMGIVLGYIIGNWIGWKNGYADGMNEQNGQPEETL